MILLMTWRRQILVDPRQASDVFRNRGRLKYQLPSGKKNPSASHINPPHISTASHTV